MSAWPCGCDPEANHRCENGNCACRKIDKSGFLGFSTKESDKEREDREAADRRDAREIIDKFIVKDSGERITFGSGSVRDTAVGKIKWSRITFGPMMRRWAQHLTTAEAKYPDPPETPGVPNFMLISTEEELQRYRESAFRHFMSWWEGDVTEDHAAALIFNVNGCEIIKEKRANANRS